MPLLLCTARGLKGHNPWACSQEAHKCQRCTFNLIYIQVVLIGCFSGARPGDPAVNRQRGSQGLMVKNRAASNKKINRVIIAVLAVKGDVTGCDWGESDLRLQSLRRLLEEATFIILLL